MNINILILYKLNRKVKSHKLVIKGTSNKISWLNEIGEHRESLSMLSSIDKSKIEFDIRQIEYLEPFHVVSLACLFEEARNRLKLAEIVVHYDKKNRACQYLLESNFFHYWNPQFDREDFLSSFNTTTMGIWKVQKERIPNYVTYVQNYFEQNFLKDQCLDSLKIALDELFNNIFDHAESDIDGYVTIQYYPNNQQLIFAVADFGIEIPNGINRYYDKIKQMKIRDIDALVLAFRKSFSIKSIPQNKGEGLHTLSGIIRTSNGSMNLFSNCARVRYTEGKFRKLAFEGTIFEIILDATCFESSEDKVDLLEI